MFKYQFGLPTNRLFRLRHLLCQFLDQKCLIFPKKEGLIDGLAVHFSKKKKKEQSVRPWPIRKSHHAQVARRKRKIYEIFHPTNCNTLTPLFETLEKQDIPVEPGVSCVKQVRTPTAEAPTQKAATP